MRWGLAPSWSKDGKAGYRTINAKAVTVTTSPTHRATMKRRRCPVPADLIYEWQKVDAKTKQPHAVTLKDGSLTAFAGLWETWKDNATGQTLETSTIITADPNQLMGPIHDRMPIILAPKDFERWLEPGESSRLPVDLMRPTPPNKWRRVREAQWSARCATTRPNWSRQFDRTLPPECVSLSRPGFEGIKFILVVVAVEMWKSALSISKSCGRAGNSTRVFRVFRIPSFPRAVSISANSQEAIFIVASVQSCSNWIGLT